MDPLSKAAMESARFKCIQCDDKYSYSNKSKHTKYQCEWLKLKCPLECQNTDSFIGVNGLLFHLMDCKLV